MKRILLLIILLLSVICRLPNAFAFNDQITHPELSKKALEKSQTVLNKYFEDNLMLNNGIKTINNGEVTYEWLQHGARMEDDPSCRASNHFHNPYLDWTASGLSDTIGLVNWWCGASSPYSSDKIKSNVTWATGYSDRGLIDPSSDVLEFNEWDWESARMYYLAYLTGLDLEVGSNVVVQNEQRRNEFLTYTFRALGHLMHLLQDMAVPAHVRNDFSQGHTRYLPDHEFTMNILKWFGNRFEDYVRHKNRSSWFDEQPVGGDFNSFRITDLWDTNILRPNTTPDQLSQINMSSLGLAEYTSINFLSMFTMFETYGPDGSLVFPYPKPEHCVVVLDKPQDFFTTFDRQYLASWNGHPGETVYKLAVVSYLKHFREVYFSDNVSNEISNKLLPIWLDGACFENYAQKLIPRAIGYSSDLLDYFFRGQLSVTAIPYFAENSFKNVTLKIKNITETEESMSEGHFFLLFRYTPVGGNPDGSDDIFIRSPLTPPCDGLAYNESVEFSFTASEITPIESWDSVTCTLVFHGTLGNETNAVVGKVFTPGKILFGEEWDKGIDGNNNWQDSGDIDRWSTEKIVDGHLIMESTRYPEPDEDGRLNELYVDFTADGSDGLLITPTTYLQFIIPEMSSAVTYDNWANHALVLYFNNGFKIEYSGDGLLFDWTDPDLLIPLVFDVNEIVTDNIFDRFESEDIEISDPLYLEVIQLMQAAYYESTIDYLFKMDVDAIRLIDSQWEE